MPPRLFHRKSKKGCLGCKNRRMKCNEVHPVCGACTKHGLACEWPNLLLSSHRSTGSAHTTIKASSKRARSKEAANAQPLGPSSPYDVEGIRVLGPEQRPLLELHLIHYYLTIDATNLPLWRDPPKLRAFWTIDAINHALRHPFLLYTIFAITALHAATSDSGTFQTQQRAMFYEDGNCYSDTPTVGTKPLSQDSYANAHRFYLNLAIREFRGELPHLSSHKADALVLASILLSIVAQNLLPEPVKVYEPPLQWISLSRSIRLVIQSAQQFLSDVPIIEAIMNMDPDMKDENAVFNPANLVPFQPILDFQPASGEVLTPIDRDMYGKAYSYIGGVYRLTQSRDPPTKRADIKRRITSFPPMVFSRFSTLLAERQPRALLVIAHLMSIAKLVEEHWWIPGEAEKHVYGVGSLLPPEWLWAMKWPLETLAEMTALRDATSNVASDIARAGG